MQKKVKMKRLATALDCKGSSCGVTFADVHGIRNDVAPAYSATNV